MKKIIFAFVFITTAVASAKDLTSRLGIGFSNQWGVELPSIATTYYPTADIGITGALGVDTQKDDSKFGFAGGVRKIIFKEENLNFYMGGLIGLLSYEIDGDNKSGLEMNGHVGAEFFWPGLDNLGVNIQTGVAITSVKDTRFRTMADHPLRAGFTFYF